MRVVKIAYNAMLPKTLALVDDDVEYSEFLSQYLADQGVDVDTFGDSNDLLAHADAYGYGFAKNHAMVDGNKRIALLAVGIFLSMNGWRLEVGQAEAVSAMLALADGTWTEDDIAAWLRLQSKLR